MVYIHSEILHSLKKKRISQLLSNKESVCSAEDAGSIPRLGISPGEGNANPLQYSYLGNLMDRGTW